MDDIPNDTNGYDTNDGYQWMLSYGYYEYHQEFLNHMDYIIFPYG